MRSLGTLLLLLTACLAVSASPVLTLPNEIQVQENFDLSRVRLASLAAMAGCPSSGALLGGEGRVLPALGSQAHHPEPVEWVWKGPSCC